MKKTVIFLLLTCAVCTGVFGQSGSDFVIEGTVLVKYQGTAKDVVIPASLGITEIGERAFRSNMDITTVKIPAGVTIIGDGAFSYCRNMVSIIIPASVTTIGDGAFD